MVIDPGDYADLDEDEQEEIKDQWEDKEHEWEVAMSECGQIEPGGPCMLAGTEYCDWECPMARLFTDDDPEAE